MKEEVAEKDEEKEDDENEEDVVSVAPMPIKVDVNSDKAKKKPVKNAEINQKPKRKYTKRKDKLIDDQSKAVAQPEQKKKRGRPRKNPL